MNTSSTRIELLWDVAGTPSLTEQQRKRVLDKLANRINTEGQLLLAEGGSRSQQQNREAVIARFMELVAEALHVPKPRRRTKPPKSSREQRLQDKKHRSEIKRLRGPLDGE